MRQRTGPALAQITACLLFVAKMQLKKHYMAENGFENVYKILYGGGCELTMIMLRCDWSYGKDE